MTGESREMTLDEWVDRLPPHHGARRERDRLREVATEIADLRARLDAEASHRLSLGADNDRLLAEIERLRADLVVAVLMNVHIELSNLQSGLDVVFPGSHRTVYDGTPESICRAVREARDGS